MLKKQITKQEVHSHPLAAQMPITKHASFLWLSMMIRTLSWHHHSIADRSRCQAHASCSKLELLWTFWSWKEEEEGCFSSTVWELGHVAPAEE